VLPRPGTASTIGSVSGTWNASRASRARVRAVNRGSRLAQRSIRAVTSAWTSSAVSPGSVRRSIVSVQRSGIVDSSGRPLISEAWTVPCPSSGCGERAARLVRLVRLAGGPELIPVDDRFANFPLPLVVHIVGAGTYAVVGAF
jgi:hypothetical protein